MTRRRIWHKHRMIDHPTRDAGFGVYVHWPFCASKRLHCDFNSHARHQPVDQDRFVAAFRREIAHMAARTAGRTVTSFFGGGTPALMKPGTVAAILDAIGGVDGRGRGRGHARSQSDERGGRAIRGLPGRRINRVSLGVQALDDADLRRLGRLHSADEALAAVRWRPRSSSAARSTSSMPDPARRRGLAGGTRRGDRTGGRASLALPADDRAGHLVRAPPQGRQARRPNEEEARSSTRSPKTCARPMACPPMRFRTTRARAPNQGAT